MLTLTVRHALGDDLRHMRVRMADAWGRVQRLTSWRVLLASGAWFVRALEATHGRNGWHPHYHVLVVSPVHLETELRPARREGDPDVAHVLAGERLGADWREAIRLELGPMHVPDEEHACDWRGIAAGEYIAKLDLAMGIELTDAAGTKRAKDGGRKPAELLRDARAHSLAARAARKLDDHRTAQLHERAQRHDTRLYGEYERATVGARLHTASAGLLAFWQAIADEERDESVISTEAVSVPGELFDLLRDLPDALPAFATACEEPDPHDAIATWLRSLGTRAIQSTRRHTSLAGWRVRDDSHRVLDGPLWADTLESARGSLVD